MEKNVAIGRRKSSIARVYVAKGKGDIVINGKDITDYFPLTYLQDAVKAPLTVTDSLSTYDFKINVSGGGIKGQAEAIRLGVSRAILLDEEGSQEHRPLLKKEGFLTRDARVVERKKPGLRKARKKEQFSKR